MYFIKKDITKKFEEKEDNPEFKEKINRSLKNELIEEYNIENQFKEDKLVLLLDNATSHTSDFVMNITEKLNIQFVFMPKYAP